MILCRIWRRIWCAVGWCHCHERRAGAGARGKSSNADDSHLVCDRGRPGPGGPRSQSQPTGRKRHRRGHIFLFFGGEATRINAGPAAQRRPLCLADRPADGFCESKPNETEAAGRAVGQRLIVLRASTEREIDAAFATLDQQRVGALLLCHEPILPHPSALPHHLGRPPFAARDVLPARIRRSGGLIELRNQHCRKLSAAWQLCRQDFQRLQTGRPAGDTVNQVRVCHQPADHESARPRAPARAACHRRRDDRINACLAAIAHSRFWHDKTELPDRRHKGFRHGRRSSQDHRPRQARGGRHGSRQSGVSRRLFAGGLGPLDHVGTVNIYVQ